MLRSGEMSNTFNGGPDLERAAQPRRMSGGFPKLSRDLLLDSFPILVYLETRFGKSSFVTLQLSGEGCDQNGTSEQDQGTFEDRFRSGFPAEARIGRVKVFAREHKGQQGQPEPMRPGSFSVNAYGVGSSVTEPRNA